MRGEVPSRNWTKSSCLWYGIYEYTPRNVTAWLPAQYMACLSNSLSATQMMPYEDFALIILWLVFDVLEIGWLSLYSWGRTVLRCCSSVIPLGGSKYLPVCLTFFFWKSLRLSWSRKYKNSVPSALLMTSVLWLKCVDIICFGLSFTFTFTFHWPLKGRSGKVSKVLHKNCPRKKLHSLLRNQMLLIADVKACFFVICQIRMKHVYKPRWTFTQKNIRKLAKSIHF